MAWKIELSADATKQLRRLDSSTSARILRFLNGRVGSLDDPRSLGKSLMGPLSGYWAYRVGDYRILTELHHDRLVVLVLEVGHRGDIYR